MPSRTETEYQVKQHVVLKHEVKAGKKGVWKARWIGTNLDWNEIYLNEKKQRENAGYPLLRMPKTCIFVKYMIKTLINKNEKKENENEKNRQKFNHWILDSVILKPPAQDTVFQFKLTSKYNIIFVKIRWYILHIIQLYHTFRTYFKIWFVLKLKRYNLI